MKTALMMAFLHCVCIGVLLLPWCPCTCGSCIFDTVQRSVHVVSPPIKLQKPVVTASEENPTPERSEPQRSKRATRDVGSDLQPIRIKTWIPSASPAPSEWERERLMAAVNEAVGQVSSLLSVRGVPDRLLLTRDINKYCKFIWRNSSSLNYMKCGRANEIYRSENCLDVTIPDEHLNGCSVYPHPDQPIPRELRPEGAGVPDTDFLLYVFIHSTDKCRAESSVLAYSAHCQTDSAGRPLAGVMVICREQLTVEKYSHHHIVQTVLHELFHVLGFSKDLYSRWMDCSSLSAQTGVKCWSHGHVTSTDETGQARLYTPAVSRTMQKHLNSTHTDLGAPLENMDAGSDGVSSHWEARVLQGSIMTASLVEPSLVRIDPFTLAALQDTGWYSVNLSRAQSLVWGEGEGDQFGTLSTCHNSSAFFCTGSGLGCHYLHLHKGECLTDQYLDGCFIFKPLANASECWIEEKESNSGQVSGEIFGSDSRCFISNLTRKTPSSVSGSVAGYCYRHRCTGVNRYQIQVKASDWLDCPAGRSIEVPGYQGLIFCPDKRLCKYPDLTPPTVRQTSRPNSVTPSERAHDVTEDGAHPRLTFDLTSVSSVARAEIYSAVVLSLTAAVSLLSSAALVYCRCTSDRVRVHVASQGPCRQPNTSARPAD